MGIQKDYYFDQKSAKIYKEISRQPLLKLHTGTNLFAVLSVGLSADFTPLVTINENGEPKCYRLPNEYLEWAETVIGYAITGENIFPANVMFTLMNGKFYVDIL